MNSNGTIPTDNPFYATASGNNRAIWALGLRNPFTFAVQPGTGRIFINDVGQDTREEVNEGLKGANYGWPTTEGPTSDPNFEGPVYSYLNSGATECAITGGAFYNPSTVQFPSSYVGDYFFADYCGNWIKRLDAAGSYTGASSFATGLSKPVSLAVGSDGSLYYLARGTGTNTGGLYRIQYTLNTPPAMTVQPQNQNVTVGDPATFSVSASGTPILSYQWQRNGAAISGATASTYTIASAQLADNGVAFRCQVTNAYGSVTSNSASLTVTANLAPTAGITSPVAGTTYAAGQTISYSGTGTDPEDGTLPASAFEWEVVFHHSTHTHPFIAPKSGSQTGSFVIPTAGETSDNVWYRIHLTVTDSDGLSHAVYRDVVPRKSTMTFATSSTGLQITLDGQPLSHTRHRRRRRGDRTDARSDLAAEQGRDRLQLLLLVRWGSSDARHFDAYFGHDLYGELPDGHADAHADPNRDTHRDEDFDPGGDGDADAHGHKNSDAHGHKNSDAHGHKNSDAYRNANADFRDVARSVAAAGPRGRGGPGQCDLQQRDFYRRWLRRRHLGLLRPVQLRLSDALRRRRDRGSDRERPEHGRLRQGGGHDPAESHSEFPLCHGGGPTEAVIGIPVATDAGSRDDWCWLHRFGTLLGPTGSCREHLHGLPVGHRDQLDSGGHGDDGQHGKQRLRGVGRHGSRQHDDLHNRLRQRHEDRELTRNARCRSQPFETGASSAAGSPVLPEAFLARR